MSEPQIINLENTVRIVPTNGAVNVIVRSGHPVQPEVDLAVRFRDHSKVEIASPAIIDASYLLGEADSLINKAANLCWGSIFTQGPGSLFSLHCEFIQRGALIGTSEKVEGVTTGNTVTFSTNTIFV